MDGQVHARRRRHPAKPWRLLSAEPNALPPAEAPARPAYALPPIQRMCMSSPPWTHVHDGATCVRVCPWAPAVLWCVCVSLLVAVATVLVGTPKP